MNNFRGDLDDNPAKTDHPESYLFMLIILFKASKHLKNI